MNEIRISWAGLKAIGACQEALGEFRDHHAGESVLLRNVASQTRWRRCPKDSRYHFWMQWLLDKVFQALPPACRVDFLLRVLDVAVGLWPDDTRRRYKALLAAARSPDSTLAATKALRDRAHLLEQHNRRYHAVATVTWWLQIEREGQVCYYAPSTITSALQGSLLALAGGPSRETGDSADYFAADVILGCLLGTQALLESDIIVGEGAE